MRLGKTGQDLKKNIKDLEKQALAKERELEGENQNLVAMNLKVAEAERAYRDAKNAAETQASRCRNVGMELGGVRREIELHRESVKKVNSLLQQQQKRSSSGLVVTDHALIRYLERKFDLNLEELRSEIVTDDLKQKVECFGDGTFGAYVVKDRTVITVLPKGDKPKTPLRKSV